MSDTQNAKSLVLRYFEAWESAPHDWIRDALHPFVSEDYRFRGVHPFNELSGLDEVGSAVWRPMREAFTALQRRQDILMAGENRIDGTLWVTSMGKLMGLFDRAWLDIPPTGKIALIPYCEFHRVDAGRIAESAFFCDIVSVMKQAGLNPLPMQTGAEIINPGPRTQDGLLYGPQDPAESQKTLNLIMRMCDDLVEKDGFQSSNSSLASTWHDDMLWFGPSGIGATYTIEQLSTPAPGPLSRGSAEHRLQGPCAGTRRRLLRRLVRLAQYAHEPRGWIHGAAGLRAHHRDARRGHVPAGRRQARRELGVHRPAALFAVAGSGCAGAVRRDSGIGTRRRADFRLALC